jgi:hypothetical protein
MTSRSMILVPRIRFLLSDVPWWMTGQTVLVNGGYTTKRGECGDGIHGASVNAKRAAAGLRQRSSRSGRQES